MSELERQRDRTVVPWDEYAEALGLPSLPAMEAMLTMTPRAVHEALVNLEARPAPAGEMTVVLGSG